MGLEGLEFKDPGAVSELIFGVELGIVGLSIEPHFMNDFEPAMSQAANGVGVGTILGAVKVIVTLGPDTLVDTFFGKEM